MHRNSERVHTKVSVVNSGGLEVTVEEKTHFLPCAYVGFCCGSDGRHFVVFLHFLNKCATFVIFNSH